MKRIVTVLIVFLFIGAMSAFAQEATREPEVLIDFSSLDDTDVDFGDVAGAGLSDTEKANLKVNLNIDNWEIDLASSSQIGENQRLSFVKPASTLSDSRTVLGVRIHFPEASYNSYAIIKPPFEIPAYDDKAGDAAGTGKKFNNKGVLKNVGTIKFIEMSVNGRNFPHGIGIILEDQDKQERMIFVDYLRYTGWKTLVWKNPNYVTEIRNRELRTAPLYPKSMPFIKFKGLIIYRDGASDGGDFVAYVKDIKVAYDQAVTSDFELDVDDEALWGIIKDREEKRKTAEMKRLGNLHVLRYLEKKKMYDGRAPLTDKTTDIK